MDVLYLMRQAEAHKDNVLGKEIARACGRLVFSALPEDKKAQLNRTVGNHILGIESVIEEAQFNMYRRKFDVAKKILTAAAEKVEAINFYADDAVSGYHTFNSIIEEIIYTYINEPEKDLRRAPEPLADLYLTLGCVLFELEDFSAAEVALKKAARWNPIDPKISFEHAEIFKRRGDMETFYEFTPDIFPHAYMSEHLARCYRNLGYYFVEKKLWKVAAGCYLLSTHYEADSRQAQSELWYIQQKAGENFSLPSIEEIKNYSEQYGFPLGAGVKNFRQGFGSARAEKFFGDVSARRGRENFSARFRLGAGEKIFRRRFGWARAKKIFGDVSIRRGRENFSATIRLGEGKNFFGGIFHFAESVI